mmetsp:Transcript_42817/g.67119  ORF Transcript_42817/g.67119 Transcript_42817/m.67119 type:complete len:82 (+) Transcript_42817:1053-1298(+)
MKTCFLSGVPLRGCLKDPFGLFAFVDVIGEFLPSELLGVGDGARPSELDSACLKDKAGEAPLWSLEDLTGPTLLPGLLLGF